MSVKMRRWAAVCLVTALAAFAAFAAGLRRVLETGSPSAGNYHYLVGTVLGGVLFVALAGMEHDDDTGAGSHGED
jgi:uncharacterized protein YqgC (DUF456 family)